MVIVAAGLTPAAATPAEPRKEERSEARALRTIYTDEFGLAHPTGIAWDRDRQMLLVTGPKKAGTELIGVSPDEQRRSRRMLPTVDADGTPAFDPKSGRLTVLADGQQVVVGPRVAGKKWASSAAASAMEELDAAGATYSGNGGLHVLDAKEHELVHVSPGGKVARTSLQGLDDVTLRGVAYDSRTDGFYVADADAENLYQVDRSGAVTDSWDLTGAGITDLQAMTLAPSGDNTDAPEEQSLYVVDNGGAGQLGGVTEISLASIPTTQLDAGYVIEPSMTATHQTSTWTPASPDPSGITHIPGEGLLVSDGEVEEMPPLYAGTNLWVAKTDGTTIVKTGTTHPVFSDEPTGVEYRPSDGHLFVSDDTSPTAVYELSGPGPDGTFGTADDPTPSTLRTAAFAATDPEGVAYDSKRDDLLISDGLSDELYRVDLGADHVFSSDDVVTHQDLEVLGVFDPEGIVYDAERDTVVVVDDTAIWELDENGSLLGKIGISSLGAKAPAGITIAPASDGSGARHYYIVARGVDNNSDPTENDGMFYEVGADVPQITNRPPTADAGPDQAIDVGDVAQLSGVSTDDGRPNGTLTYLWSVRSGPGSVSFGTPTSARTSATFSAVGSYVLRLTVSDSSLSVYDEVTVSVYQAGDLRTATIRLGAGSDDAREGTAVGGDFVNLARAHDMLGEDFDSATGTWFPITTGIRFPGLPVPHGGQVVSARIQFESYLADTDPASVTFRGEASDNAPTYESVGGNVSSRPDTNAAVVWNPDAWTAVGQSGAAQLSPDLSAILQEIVDRPGWSAGNAAAFTVTGTGRRAGKSYETNGGPVLQLEYRTTKPVNTAPTVNAGVDATVTLPGSASLDGTVSDDGLPNPPGAVTTTWSKVSGPGTVTFGNASAVDTTASFSAAGTYVLRLTGDDSALGSSDEVTITVQTPTPTNQAPTVNAGPDRSVTFPASAALNGTISDDGLPNPPGAVTTSWSKVSGPGTVTFANASAVDTRASFTAPGTYVLRLTGSDSARSTTDDVTVIVKQRPQARLAVTLSPNPLRVGRPARISGTLSPVVDSRLVRLQRWNGSRWRTTATRTVQADQERFSFTVRPRRSARFKYRVIAPRSGDYARIGSGNLVLRVYRARIVTVRPRPDVVVVQNTGAVRIDLGSWSLRNRRNGRLVRLPEFVVRPRQRVRIHTGRGVSDRRDLYLGSRAMWGAHGVVVLRDRTRALVARLRY
jgi:hypothetical protein